MKSLETKLRAVRSQNRKALVPYFMAGLTSDWVQHVEAAVHAGADAVEIGIPFSDPSIFFIITGWSAQSENSHSQALKVQLFLIFRSKNLARGMRLVTSMVWPISF